MTQIRVDSLTFVLEVLCIANCRPYLFPVAANLPRLAMAFDAQAHTSNDARGWGVSLGGGCSGMMQGEGG